MYSGIGAEIGKWYVPNLIISPHVTEAQGVAIVSYCVAHNSGRKSESVTRSSIVAQDVAQSKVVAT